MGSSGGGPYALALAALAPERVSQVFVLGGPGVHAEVNPEELDDADRQAIDLLAAGDAAGAVSLLMPWAEKFFGPMQGLSGEEFHDAFQQTVPPGETWFDDRPDLLPAFEADFRRAIATFDGFVRDNLSWLGAWDFDLAAVTVPGPARARRRRPDGPGRRTASGCTSACRTASGTSYPVATAAPPSAERWTPSPKWQLSAAEVAVPSGRGGSSVRRTATSPQDKCHFGPGEVPPRGSGGLEVPLTRGVDQAYADSAHALQVARLGRGLAELAA